MYDINRELSIKSHLFIRRLGYETNKNNDKSNGSTHIPPCISS